MSNCKKKIKNELHILCNNSTSKFLTIPDDILLQILQCLDTISLINISLVCRRLYFLTKDKTLQQFFDIRLKPLSLKDLWKVLQRKLTATTTEIHFKGFLQQKTITSAFMNQLNTKCPNISSLSLELFDLRDISLELFPPNLKSLSLRGSMLTMGWFDCLKNNFLLELTYVDLHSCSKISNNDLEALAYLRNTQTLILSDCFRISARGLPPITANMKKLKHVDFSGCPGVNNVVLFYLSKLQYLETLIVRFCHLITSAGLTQLFQRDVGKTLRSLDVYSCHELTNEALDVIKNQTYCLRLLDIGGCNKICSENINDFITSLPKCTVKYSNSTNNSDGTNLPCSEINHSVCNRK